MDRRQLLSMAGVGAAGLVAATATGTEARAAFAADDNIHEKCAEACVNCEKECNHGFHHCYTQVKAGKMEHAKVMHLLVDCGDICGTSGKLVARMSPLMTYSCKACGDSCATVIAAIETLKDSEMKDVMEALKECQKSCTEMVKMMG